MPNSSAEQFLNKVEKVFRPILDRVIVSTAAVKVADKWIAFYTRIAVAHSLETGAEDLQIMGANSRFIAFSVQYPIEELRAIFKGILNSGHIDIAVQDQHPVRVFLSRFHAGIVGNQTTLTFFSMVRARRKNNAIAAFRPSFQIGMMGPDRISDLVNLEEMEEVSSELRLNRPSVNGLRGLLNLFGTAFDADNLMSNTCVEAIASLPLTVYVSKASVTVRCPATATEHLRMQYYFSPQGASEPQSPSQLAPSDGMINARFETPWPEHADQASAYLYHDSEAIDQLELGRWSGTANWRIAVDGFFDPDQKYLNQALGPTAKGDEFEHAIVRLIGLSGLVVNWYGKARKSDRPDLAVFARDSAGSRLVLLGECTIAKPQAKFTSLRSRSEELRKALNDKIHVISVVFTACDPAPSDYDDAVRSGVVLLGRDQIEHMFGLIARDAELDEVLEYITVVRM